MTFHRLFLSATSACFELNNMLPYYCETPYRVVLNGSVLEPLHDANVFSLFHLKPNTEYTVGTTLDAFTLTIQTKEESACINAQLFGAVGDGEADDTRALQSAIYACPANGRVFVPRGVYKTGPLVLKSHMTLELAKDAVLLGSTRVEDYPVWPGEIDCISTGEKIQCATWEGEPRASHMALLSAHHARDIRIIGEGVIDGNAQNSVWWHEPKARKEGRPRLVFLNGCEDVVLHGVTGQNSAAWNLHPFFSRNIGFYDIAVIAPKDSPNTDGCDPESCDGVEIIGARFSVGDDAIAIKSGKLYMGATYKTPAKNHTIRNCLMEFAHGAVVMGSEMAGGVQDVFASQCYFRDTDRGLRIKTRRGRGKDAVIDGITFHTIKMEHVLTPLVINMFYSCDKDGKTEYVWTKEKLPVDERTPRLGKFHFKDIVCVDCEYAAGFFYGLPEQPIEEVTIENVSFSFKEDAGWGYPAMMSHIEAHHKTGLYYNNIRRMALKNVSIMGVEGPAVIAENVEERIEE